MKAELEERFNQNLDRVTHLVAVYEAEIAGRGRRGVETTDVLRAAVVFLHATLEDLLRSLLDWKLPLAPAKHLSDIPLQGKAARTKFTLDELAVYRGRTVDDVIALSVSASLEKSNFNDPGEVRDVLEKIGLRSDLLTPHRKVLGPMMARRHWIVHRADLNPAP